MIVIMGFASAIVFPALSRSIAGNRIRIASRAIVMAGRHARSLAVLNQKQVSLKFDIDAGKISLFFPKEGKTEYERKLEKVCIVQVQVGDDDPFVEGQCEVVYQNNGTCTPYMIEVEDERKKTVIIDVDSLSSARTRET